MLRCLIATLSKSFLVFSFGRLLECRGGSAANHHCYFIFQVFHLSFSDRLHTFRNNKEISSHSVISSPCSFPSVI